MSESVPYAYLEPVKEYWVALERGRVIKDRYLKQRKSGEDADIDTVAWCLSLFDSHYIYSDDLSVWASGKLVDEWLDKHDAWFGKDVDKAKAHLRDIGVAVSSSLYAGVSFRYQRMMAGRMGVSYDQWRTIVYPVLVAGAAVVSWLGTLPLNKKRYTLPTMSFSGNRHRKVLAVPREVMMACEQLRTGVVAAHMQGISLKLFNWVELVGEPATHLVVCDRYTIWLDVAPKTVGELFDGVAGGRV